MSDDYDKHYVLYIAITVATTFIMLVLLSVLV